MSIAARNAILADGAAPGPTPAYWGLCFTAEQANSTVAMTATGSAPSVSLLYSTDAANWSPFVVGSTVVTLASVGDKVWLKAGSGGNTRFGSSTSNYNTFSLSGLVAASGNIMSLLNGEKESYDVSTYCFYALFLNCASLTAAPELPATIMTTRCYGRMFESSSITASPMLPAETLQQTCYLTMFRYCSNLVSIRVSAKAFSSSTTNWVTGVAATGTFYCPTALGTNETISRGNSACPTGWTVINTDA